MLLIILGAVALFFVKWRRQSGGTQLTPPSPQTEETSESIWPVHILTSSNPPYDPYDVSSPLFSFSVPSMVVANLPQRSIFPER